MKHYLYLIFLLPVFVFSQNEKFNWVGNIDFNEKTDKKDFYLCNENQIYQYFNDSNGLQYKGEKLVIEEEFRKKYNPENLKKDNAWVRIRFVVNCNGESDRFRILTANYDYQPIEIDSKITSQLLDITKNLKGWIPKSIKDKKVDYYQYLTFKIKDGKIDEILP